MRDTKTIQAIYRETFSLLKGGGCFLNFDRMTPSLGEQLEWLRDAGFIKVQCFWDGGRRAIIGGFKEPAKPAAIRSGRLRRGI